LVIVPPPLAAVATWKSLRKVAPVEAEPVLDIVVLKVWAVPAVAVAGDGAPAVRSGWAAAVVMNVASAEYPVPTELVA
jgi:hypothetical protein